MTGQNFYECTKRSNKDKVFTRIDLLVKILIELSYTTVCAAPPYNGYIQGLLWWYATQSGTITTHSNLLLMGYFQRKYKTSRDAAPAPACLSRSSPFIPWMPKWLAGRTQQSSKTREKKKINCLAYGLSVVVCILGTPHVTTWVMTVKMSEKDTKKLLWSHIIYFGSLLWVRRDKL